MTDKIEITCHGCEKKHVLTIENGNTASLDAQRQAAGWVPFYRTQLFIPAYLCGPCWKSNKWKPGMD